MTSNDRVGAPRRGALGKGLSSLLGELDDTTSAGLPDARGNTLSGRTGEAQVLRIPTIDIDPNPQQPRRIFNEAALMELAQSLKQDGFLQPILLTKSDQPGRFTLIAGERRWRAAKLAELPTVPALIKDGVNEDLLRLALIENIQRQDLNIIEEAEAYAALIRDYGLTQEQCADRVGKERSTVANSLRLLSLPLELQDDILDGRLTMGHGRALLSLEDKILMLRGREIVLKKSLSVRQTEELCRSFKEKPDTEPLTEPEEDPNLHYVSESLRSMLHTKVRLAGTATRGRIEISYFSAAELERILRLIGHRFE